MTSWEPLASVCSTTGDDQDSSGEKAAEAGELASGGLRTVQVCEKVSVFPCAGQRGPRLRCLVRR